LQKLKRNARRGVMKTAGTYGALDRLWIGLESLHQNANITL